MSETLRTAVEALIEKWWRWSQEGERIINHAGVAQDICKDLRAALATAAPQPTLAEQISAELDRADAFIALLERSPNYEDCVVAIRQTMTNNIRTLVSGNG